MLANEYVHGDVLECRDTSCFREDVDASQGVPGDFDAVARLLLDDSGVGPVLKIAEYLGIVLNHLNRLVLGFLEVSIECRSKEPRSITEQLLVHAEHLFLGADFDLDDRIKGVPARKLAIVVVVKDATNRLGLYGVLV